MISRRSKPLAANLAEARRLFTAWRRTRRPGTRIPDHLWQLASELARRRRTAPAVRFALPAGQDADR